MMLVVIMINYFGINPFLEALKIEALSKEVMESVFSERYRTWHGIASAAYLFECFLLFDVSLGCFVLFVVFMFCLTCRF